MKQKIDYGTLFSFQFNKEEIKEGIKIMEPIDAFYVQFNREC